MRNVRARSRLPRVRRGHGALGVILARGLGAERGQHAVARVLQDPAVQRVDCGGEARERAVHHGVDLLRVQPLADRGRTDDIDKQH